MLRFTIPERNHTHVVFIHGANASPKSFNYIVENSNITDCTKVRYFSNDGFYNNLEKIRLKLEHITCPVFIIAHSMGGIYALHLSQYMNVVGAVSIATPFGGSRTADWAKFFVSRRYYKEMGIKSAPIQQGHNIPINFPWTQIVTTEGAIPVHIVKNDGVCTVSSMKFRKDMQHKEIPYSHYEIMNSPEVVNTVNKKLKSNFIYFGGE